MIGTPFQDFPSLKAFIFTFMFMILGNIHENIHNILFHLPRNKIMLDIFIARFIRDKNKINARSDKGGGFIFLTTKAV